MKREEIFDCVRGAYDGKMEYFFIHCDTFEKAKEFCNFLHEQGFTWGSGRSYNLITNYASHQEKTIYGLYGGYAGLHLAKMNGYHVITQEEFFKRLGVKVISQVKINEIKQFLFRKETV